jgi:hypothetical protein
MAATDEKEPDYSKMTPAQKAKYASKSKEEAKEVYPGRKVALDVLKKKAKEGSAAEEAGESKDYEDSEDKEK